MSFLPRDFQVPATLETDRFRMRSITIHDLVKDYDAVMSSRERLWAMFGEAWGWPAPDVTLEQDLVHLGWHQHEFELRRSFDYAVMSPDERQLLGCVYVDPPEKVAYDAEVSYWVRTSEADTGLDEHLGHTVRAWISRRWPFHRVAYPGRDVPWPDYLALPGR